MLFNLPQGYILINPWYLETILSKIASGAREVAQQVMLLPQNRENWRSDASHPWEC